LAVLRPREGGLRRGEIFWLRLTTGSAQCLRLSERFFRCICCTVDGAWFTGVVRGCGTSEMNECSALENEPVAELHLTDATGTLCYCTDELCNAAAQTSVAGTAVKFGVASLLAMTAVRVHSG